MLLSLGRKILLVVHIGGSDVGKAYSEDLKNRCGILAHRLETSGGEIAFSRILLRKGIQFEWNNILYMSIFCWQNGICSKVSHLGNNENHLVCKGDVSRIEWL